MWSAADISETIFPVDHPSLEPKDFVKSSVVESDHLDYMFFGCIKFINEVRKSLLSFLLQVSYQYVSFNSGYQSCSSSEPFCFFVEFPLHSLKWSLDLK